MPSISIGRPSSKSCKMLGLWFKLDHALCAFHGLHPGSPQSVRDAGFLHHAVRRPQAGSEQITDGDLGQHERPLPRLPSSLFRVRRGSSG
jgi:hypothetical protein